MASRVAKIEAYAETMKGRGLTGVWGCGRIDETITKEHEACARPHVARTAVGVESGPRPAFARESEAGLLRLRGGHTDAHPGGKGD